MGSEDFTLAGLFTPRVSARLEHADLPIQHLTPRAPFLCHSVLQVPTLLLALPGVAKTWFHLDRGELNDMSQENCIGDDQDLASVVQHHPDVHLHLKYGFDLTEPDS